MKNTIPILLLVLALLGTVFLATKTLNTHQQSTLYMSNDIIHHYDHGHPGIFCEQTFCAGLPEDKLNACVTQCVGVIIKYQDSHEKVNE